VKGQFLHEGRFELLSSLGEGGFGTVYEAFDRSQQARVALKALTRINPDALFRFKREFRALQDLAHPNLVTLGELFESAGQWFFTMELVPGCDFLSFVRPSLDVFHEGRLRASLLQLAEGLNALHSTDTIHRDVKPSNTRVTPQGRLVLLDFGLVTHGDEARQSTAAGVLGTVAYMAPEQASGGRLGPAADWYSVGIVLYEALTGTLPFEGSPIEILMRKQGAAPKPPSMRSAAVPADLDQLCTQLLQTDPAARPTGLEIVARLRERAASESSTARAQTKSTGSTLAPPFLGRQHELALLSEAAAVTRRGHATALYVHGASGIGKSALVRNFLEDLEAKDPKTLVLYGRCFERETVPYKAFDGVIDEASRYLRRLSREECAGLLPRRLEALCQVFPVLSRVEQVARAPRGLRSSVDRRTQRQEAFGALGELFARLSDRVHVVIAIDDLQYADADSIALLDSLLEGPERPAFFLIALGRNPDECSDPIKSCIERVVALSPDSGTLEVPELGAAEALELASRLLTRYGGEPADAPRVVRESGAQPLLIDELARFFVVNAASGVQPDLDQMLKARIAQLSASAARLLQFVATAGIAVPQEVITVAARIEPEQQMQAISSLRLARLIKVAHRAERTTLETFHDRVRVCGAGMLSSEERVAMNRALARAMEGSAHADPAALALFWMEAGEANRAAEFALQAGDRAGRAFAFERAASLYRRVLEAGATGEQRRLLYERLGDALANAGRCPEAADAFLHALEGASKEQQLELRRRACQQLLQSGHLDRGLTVAGELLAHLDLSLPETPGQALRSLIWQRMRLALRGMKFKERPSAELVPEDLSRIDVLWSVSTSLGAVDHIRGTSLATRLLRHALDCGEPKRIARALALESCLILPADASKRSLAGPSIAHARAIAQRNDDPHGLGLCLLAEGICAVVEGEMRRSLTCADAASVIFRDSCSDVTWERNNAANMSLLAIYFLGDHAELGRRVPLLLRDADERGDLFARANTVLSGGYQLAVIDGRPQEARDNIDRVMTTWSVSAFHVQHFMHMIARAQIGLYENTAVEVYRDLLERWPLLQSSQLLRAEIVSWTCHWVRGRAAVAAAGHMPEQRPKLLRAALADAKRLDQHAPVIAHGCAAMIRATALQAQGNSKGAIDAFGRACALLERADANAFLGCARYRLAEATNDVAGMQSAHSSLQARAVVDVESFVRMVCPL